MTIALLSRLRRFIDASEAEMSHRDVANHLRTALHDDIELGDDGFLFVVDVFDDSVVYEVEVGGDSGLFERPYSMGEDGSVEFGDPVEVRRVTTYEPVQPVEEEEGDEPAEEGGRVEIESDLVPLIERAVADDGTVRIKLIEPGWGSSGYYSPEVLQDAAGVFAAGTHMFLDHPTEAEEFERPERSLRDLAGVLVEDAHWEDDGPQGPGLYADARVFSPFRELLNEMAPHIGVSIRARGTMEEGVAEGRAGKLVTGIVDAASVDYVTLPGAGGAIGELLESARHKPAQEHGTEEETVAERKEPQVSEETRALQESVERLTAQLRERDARDYVRDQLAAYRIPDAAKAKLLDSLSSDPPVTESGDLDRDAFGQRVEEAVKAEIAYLESVAPSGRVLGMGVGEPRETSDEDLEKELASLFAEDGMSEAAAQAAARSSA